MLYRWQYPKPKVAKTLPFLSIAEASISDDTFFVCVSVSFIDLTQKVVKLNEKY